MKKIWLGAAAAGALAAAAFTPALAGGKYDVGQNGYVNSLMDEMAATGGADSLASPHFGTWGYDATGQDPSVKPGDDFFLYANGAWLARTEIPSDRVRFGNFDKLAELSQARSKKLVEDAVSGRSKDKDSAKIAAIYKAYMDEAGIEKAGVTPIAADLNDIKAVKTKAEMAALMGKANYGFQGAWMGVGIGADAKDPDHYAVYMGQGGLGLPDRDYYLSPVFADKKAKYQAYIEQMLGMAGWPNPAENAKAIVELETKIAQASWTRIERRDRDKTYNPMSPAEIAKSAPGFDWDAYWKTTGVGGVQRVIVSTPSSITKVAAIYAETPLDVIKAKQAFGVVDGAAGLLPKRFADAKFAFRNKELLGQPEQTARWKRGVGQVEGIMGESLGRAYVADYFTPEAKAQADELVHNILTAMHGRLERLDWMSAETKAEALKKLSKVGVKIGYPEKWRDYSPLTVSATDAVGNVRRSGAYEWRREVDRLNKPVDKMEWGMTPQTVNAYYRPTGNDINFPAAILQPPFFDPKADPAVNYGGIGAVIGHELTHGFDDQGRKSDGDGVQREWWTKEDSAKFDAQAAKFGAQYDTYETVPGVHVQGKLTMGENIADLGGLLLALDAYHASLHGQPAPVIDGLTGDQRVFLGFAQVWRDKMRDDAAKQRASTDPHSPAHFRVDGPTRNIDAWYEAFGVKPGEKYYLAPADRVRIW